MFDFGFQGGGWELCARLVDDPTFFVAKWVSPIGIELERFYELIPGSLPLLRAQGGPPPDFPHFPYGENVEPD